MSSASLSRLVASLTGIFSNQQQAIANPAWFVHLRLWQRQTPLRGDGLEETRAGASASESVTLFLEQANVLKLDIPYRQRLLRLTADESGLWGQYYQLKDFAAWRGCGQEPERLGQLSWADVELLPGCRLAIAPTLQTEQPSGFEARLVPGGGCEFEYEGKIRRVEVGFDLFERGADQGGVCLKTYDKGIDPETGRGLWGALMGPYEFERLE